MKSLSKENSPEAARYHLKMVVTALIIGGLLGVAALIGIVTLAEMILK